MPVPPRAHFYPLTELDFTRFVSKRNRRVEEVTPSVSPADGVALHYGNTPSGVPISVHACAHSRVLSIVNFNSEPIDPAEKYDSKRAADLKSVYLQHHYMKSWVTVLRPVYDLKTENGKQIRVGTLLNPGEYIANLPRKEDFGVDGMGENKLLWAIRMLKPQGATLYRGYMDVDIFRWAFLFQTFWPKGNGRYPRRPFLYSNVPEDEQEVEAEEI